jgi:hypothetical protein
MSWKKSEPMEQRVEFVRLLLGTSTKQSQILTGRHAPRKKLGKNKEKS